jgi:hypothetical protein
VQRGLEEEWQALGRGRERRGAGGETEPRYLPCQEIPSRQCRQGGLRDRCRGFVSWKVYKQPQVGGLPLPVYLTIT